MQTVTTDILDQLENFLNEVAPQVIDNMLGWKSSPATTEKGNEGRLAFTMEGVNGAIGYGGKLTGTVFFSVTSGLAGDITRQILDEDHGHESHEAGDVIGELTNMIAGGVKSRLCDAGYDIVMSIPNIIRGPKIHVSGKDVNFRVATEFKLDGRNESYRVIVLGKQDN